MKRRLPTSIPGPQLEQAAGSFLGTPASCLLPAVAVSVLLLVDCCWWWTHFSSPRQHKQ